MPTLGTYPWTLGALLAILVIAVAIICSPLILGKLEALPAVLFIALGFARLT